jgi:ubiquinone/menaquinone biosynthesis C-methylase UbiE
MSMEMAVYFDFFVSSFKNLNMKRKGIHRPTVEDAIEISGIEIMHVGGVEMTKRTAEVSGLKKGMNILDVSSGRGTQAIFYAKTYQVNVTGIDISPEMIETARINAKKNGVDNVVKFMPGDSQNLPFEDNTFDAVINECAVGIPDDSQKVLNEMLRVVKTGGKVTMHESTWRKALPAVLKEEISERYGTTPLEYEEWTKMLENAGAKNIASEFEYWSQPEMFWKIRKDRNIKNHKNIMSVSEKVTTTLRIIKKYGFKGVLKAFENEKILFKHVLNGNLGYCLFSATK